MDCEEIFAGEMVQGKPIPLLRSRLPKLSKSRFIAGYQCHKRLYLECYSRDLADPVTPALQASFDVGTRVGEIARNSYPGGRLIDLDHIHHQKAEELTMQALKDPSVPSVYEAAFTYNDIRIRADIMARVGDDLFDLIDVKSTGSFKSEYEMDVAIQLFVVEGCGLHIRNAYLLHVDRRKHSAHSSKVSFKLVDITETCRLLRPLVLKELDAMRRPLWLLAPPEISSGLHCRLPYVCPFTGHCSNGW